MTVPCVRVAREDGERVRRALAERGLLDRDHEITAADGRLYVPIADPAAVADEYAVVERDAPTRETRTMPADILGFEPSHERLGGIVILDEDDPERARQVARAVMESDLPATTVLNRASEVTGKHRTREWDVLAGESTETIHREYGFEYALDVARVYFSPRLATERRRVAEQVDEGERALDMFCGVGPFAIPVAARGATAVGVDANPAAVAYCHENARRNGVEERVTVVEADVRTLGSASQAERSDGGHEAAGEYVNWADRLVMNLPHSAHEFLDTAVALAAEDCTLHYYDIASEDAPYEAGEAAIRAAAEPEGYAVSVETRHAVRSYAPHELNVRLDVALRR